MKTSRVWAFALVPALVTIGLRVAGAAPLDVPQHRSRTSSAHLTESHRHTAAHAASHAPAASGKSALAHATTGHATAGHATAKSAPAAQQARLTPRGRQRAAV